MFNPFVFFQKAMIDGFRDMKRRYLVAQTYREGHSRLQLDDKIPILLSDYEDLGLARIHFNAITDDPYKAIVDLEKLTHRNKISEMLEEDSMYKVYAAFIEDAARIEERMKKKYSTNIRNYVSQKTNWRIGARDTICPKLELIFGELFVTIKYTNQVVRVRLADLEKY